MSWSGVMPSGRFPEEGGLVLTFANEPRSVPLARQAVRKEMLAQDQDDLVTRAELVVAELVANAVLHTSGPIELRIQTFDHGVRVGVADTNPAMPLAPTPSADSMTGRGLLLVRFLADRLGFDAAPGGKVVWAELRNRVVPGDQGAAGPVEMWPGSNNVLPGPYHVELGEVPTGLLIEAKAQVDNMVRELVLAASGAEVSPHLPQLIDAVVGRFSEPRMAIKRQALEAARLGLSQVRLSLDLGDDAADSGEVYLRALDEADEYCKAARLLTLEIPPEHRVFRNWYVGEVIDQVRRAQAGERPRPPQAFAEVVARRGS